MDYHFINIFIYLVGVRIVYELFQSLCTGPGYDIYSPWRFHDFF